ncbi:hypothetical protein BABINDRAFT_159828 [Babjeviella inositovora NRRL Y-12698]|uniref:S1 motif domain-containing protein n=1 Tax=Babjeviella inositovora NRRL Y-12698 TaxID=984486 RepID=A0A1E3QWU9_9ASCO|nr:uncharacterized protein BABINDRAFT_159828 [Babjeviella inositovora NRRL Y-12698]ODQ81552.1 hypothetical protein BABINDRAFT_159828 [Babjeviella inositovora NRRL Y-12698]
MDNKRKRSDDTTEARELKTPSVLNAADTAFPRGGATALTPLEVKEISNEAARDVLFEAAEAKKRVSAEGEPLKKKKRTTKKKAAAPVEEKKVLPIEGFNFKSLIPGSIVLGQVSQINRLDVALALADNLVGYIPITAISAEISQQLEDFEENESDDEEETEKAFPDLAKIFRVGQWLRATVVESTELAKQKKNQNKKKRIQLSVEPTVVNQALEDEDLISGNVLQVSVKSLEDHGAILNVGKDGLAGFISNKELKNGDVAPESLFVGTPLLSTIVSKNNRTVTVRLQANLKKQNVISTISTIDAVLAGILVDALVTDVVSNGILCKVFGLLDATVNLTHAGIYDSAELKHKFAVGSKVKARVMGVVMRNGEKKLILSLLPHTLNLTLHAWAEDESSPLEAFALGHIFEDVEIKGSDANYLFVDVGNAATAGQVHQSRLDAKKDLGLDYKTGSHHRARVLGYNSVDNLYILTMDTKVLNQEYIRTQDIPVGIAVIGEVTKVTPEKGLTLKIFGDFEAHVPLAHMSDIKLIYPERKFKVGAKVKGRVLRISRVQKEITVTLKNSLVTVEEEEVLASIETAEVGMRTRATIERFQDRRGAIVSFFGDLKAFLPNSEISETFVKDPAEHLRLGQTVKVTLLAVAKDTKRITVTCRAAAELTATQKEALSTLTPGKSVVEVSVVEKTKDSVIVELPENNLRGVIFAGHLSDGNHEQNRALLKKTAAGSKLEVVVLEKDAKSRVVALSAKKSLIDDAKAGKLPTAFRDIKADDEMLHGYVKSVNSLGLFVGFAGKVTGLVLAKYATEKPVEDLSTVFHKNQSVTCRVIRLDLENKRFLLSLKEKTETTESEEAVNPADASTKLLSEYVPGKLTKAIVKSVKSTQLNVQLADNQQGRVDITQVFDDVSAIQDRKNPLAQFQKGDVLDVKVIGFHDARTHRFLPVTHRKSKNIIVELSAKTSDLVAGPYTPLSLAETAVGTTWPGFINNEAAGYFWVSLSPTVKGRLSLMDLSDDGAVFANLKDSYPVGSAIQVAVKDVDTVHNAVSLSARQHAIKSLNDVKVGVQYPARVLVAKDSYVLVELGEGVVAASYVTDALDNYADKVTEVFEVNSFVSATVLEVNTAENKVAVSLRTTAAKDKLVTAVSDLTRGDVVRGFVKNVSAQGVYVALGRNMHALVRITDLSDSYLKEWKKYFKPNQAVIGKVISAEEEGRVLLTLKESEVNGELNVMKRFEDLVVGDVFEGSVRRATDFGVFVKLDGTLNVSGLCHHSQISDNAVANVTSLFGEGDRVKIKVLAIDGKKKQLSLGMKASYFEVAEDVDDDVDMEDVEEVESDEEIAEGSDDEVMDDALNAEDSEDDSEVEEEVSASPVAGLSTGFDWTASILDQAQDDESSSDEELEQDKKKKKAKRAVTDKTSDINTRAPQSTGDFERILIGNPNSSIMWMNYMSFQLQLSEVEKAREIGERALKTINYREEQEKLNMWIALLNLENTFGSDESLEEVFKRSCQFMEPLIMHIKLVGIYVLSEKLDKAEELYQAMIKPKKFGQKLSVWEAYGAFLLDQNKAEAAHQLLAKALQVLSKQEHIDVVRKFAVLEFAKGDPEQGRSLFEGIVSEKPKRADIWNVYIDQEIKKDNKEKAEGLFERVLSRKLSRKVAKSLFGKWLALEEKKADDVAADYVRAKADKYVQTHFDN